MENRERGGAVWVFAEARDDKLQPVSLQLVGKARGLADQLGVSVEVVLLGDTVRDMAKVLIAAGADVIYIADSADLALYHPDMYGDIIVTLAKEKHPDILLFGSTFIGRELAPIVAAKLKTGLTAHCIDLVIGADTLLDQKIPAYGGLISIICPEKKPQMATIAGGVFPLPDLDPARSGKIVQVPVIDCTESHLRIVEIVKEESAGQSLESADFVVAGGAGVGDRNSWDRIQDLSQLLNAALGCTRPVVDEGWAELETMIGQSGKMVSPTFYLGIGLSGELQHMVGIKGAQTMIAVNNDKKSPVFEQVDYGIVEDCSTFIPLLIDTIKEKYNVS